MKELVEPSAKDGTLYVDRQTAIMFEMCNFKRYYPFSLRMLKGLREKWESVPDQHPRLLDELKLTIEFMERKL